MVYNVNLCVNLCKQIGVLATLFCSKNQYDFATLREPNLCKQNSIVATLFRSKFICVILLLHSAHACRLILPVK
jgi:hypothetical protein